MYIISNTLTISAIVENATYRIEDVLTYPYDYIEYHRDSPPSLIIPGDERFSEYSICTLCFGFDSWISIYDLKESDDRTLSSSRIIPPTQESYDRFIDLYERLSEKYGDPDIINIDVETSESTHTMEELAQSLNSNSLNTVYHLTWNLKKNYSVKLANWTGCGYTTELMLHFGYLR